MLKEFIDYLTDQIGQPYLWGGQHTKLTPDNYVRVIEKKEAGRGGYPDGTSYAQAVIDFCKKKFDAGASVLYAYDCSGLGVYWLLSVAHLWKADANANTMMHRCMDLDTAGPPAKGWWVFRLDDSKKRAVHIGYMIDNEYLIEAAGRKYGVVKTKFRAHDWDAWGIPKVFEDEIRHPDPKPEPTVRSIWPMYSASTWGCSIREIPRARAVRVVHNQHEERSGVYHGPAAIYKAEI